MIVAVIDADGVAEVDNMADLLMGSNGSSVSVGDTSSTFLMSLEEVLVDENQSVPDGLTESSAIYVSQDFEEAFVTDLPNWVTGVWSECSVACGEGIISRTVTCSASYDAICEDSLGPAPGSSASCSQSCGDSDASVAGIVVSVTVASCCACCLGALLFFSAAAKSPQDRVLILSPKCVLTPMWERCKSEVWMSGTFAVGSDTRREEYRHRNGRVMWNELGHVLKLMMWHSFVDIKSGLRSPKKTS